jgi:hypothetical protein
MLLNNYEIDTALPNFSEILCVFLFLFFIFMYFYTGLFFSLPEDTAFVLFDLSDVQLQHFAFTNLEQIGLCLFMQFGFILVICVLLMFVTILGSIMIIKKIK